MRDMQQSVQSQADGAILGYRDPAAEVGARMGWVPLSAVLAALLLVSAVPATGQQPISDLDRAQFYTACVPLGLHVFVEDDDEYPIGLTEDRVRTMAESRLRAARLYTSAGEARDALVKRCPVPSAPRLPPIRFCCALGAGHLMPSGFGSSADGKYVFPWV